LIFALDGGRALGESGMFR